VLSRRDIGFAAHIGHVIARPFALFCQASEGSALRPLDNRTYHKSTADAKNGADGAEAPTVGP